MPADGVTEGAEKPASMDDLKALETSLRSSMESQMIDMKQYLADLLKMSVPPIIPIMEDKDSLLDGEASASPSSKKPLEGDNLANVKVSSASPKKGLGEKEGYNAVDWRSPDPPIPHPHINTRGDPPKLNVEDFNRWQFEFRSHVCSASNELWRIIVEGYKPFNANNLNRREVVDHQLNSVALNMIHQAVGPKDLAYIRTYTTAKEAWDGLSEIFVGKWKHEEEQV